MALKFNGTSIPSSGTVKFNGTSLNKVIFNKTLVWRKAASYSFSMSKVSESYGGQNGDADHDITWTSTGVKIDYTNMSYGGGEFTFSTTSALDLSGYDKLTITYNMDGNWNSKSKIGVGSSRGSYSLVSATPSDGNSNTVTLNVSSLSSGYLTFYFNAYINANYPGSRSFSASITAIKGS